MEIIHSIIRKYSANRNLQLVDCAAGNCYLSFLMYYFYNTIISHKVTIHCIDNNKRLMENSKQLADKLEFRNMKFYHKDILDFKINDKTQLVYSLHACDNATDKTLALGVKLVASNILSVSCCQHNLKKQFKKHTLTGITKYKVFKDKITYMLGDSLRALLLESIGYKTDIIEFISSRYTDKNIMIRGIKSNHNKAQQAKDEYIALSSQFNVRSCFEDYLAS